MPLSAEIGDSCPTRTRTPRRQVCSVMGASEWGETVSRARTGVSTSKGAKLRTFAGHYHQMRNDCRGGNERVCSLETPSGTSSVLHRRSYARLLSKRLSSSLGAHSLAGRKANPKPKYVITLKITAGAKASFGSHRKNNTRARSKVEDRRSPHVARGGRA